MAAESNSSSSTKATPEKHIPSQDKESGGHPGSTMGGVAPVSTVTDTWTTAMPHPDATKLSSLPKAVAEAIDGKNHSDDEVLPDEGGKVLDHRAADANRAAPQ